MGLFDRLFGAEEQSPAPAIPQKQQAQRTNTERTDTERTDTQRTDDEIAVERYRYLLRTAPPEAIEQVHEEAFAALTEDQRKAVFAELSQNAPAGEQPRGTDARSLATAATRSELRQPGTLERSFQGPSFGSMVGSSLLGTVAGFVIGSAIMSAFMPNDLGGDQAGGDQAGGDDSGDGSDSADAGSDSGDASADAGSDSGGGDSGGGDFGGGDFGGDFGGGDFGGF